MSTRRPVAPDPGIHPSRSGGFARAAFQIGFWIPLLFCTWAALVPAPPDNPVFQLSDVLLHAAAFTYLSFAFVLAWLEGGSGPAYLRAFLCMLGYGPAAGSNVSGAQSAAAFDFVATISIKRGARF